MQWRTHLVVGMNSLWLAGLSGKIDESFLALLPAAAIGSLLPDIDTDKGAKIHYAGGGVLGGFKGLFFGKYFHHRGLMHSLFVTVLFFFFCFVFFGQQHPLLPYIFAFSYLSHLVIDGFNTGVGYLYPFSLKRFALVPKMFRTPVKGAVDNLLFMVGVFGLALFFLSFASSFPMLSPGLR